MDQSNVVLCSVCGKRHAVISLELENQDTGEVEKKNFCTVCLRKYLHKRADYLNIGTEEKFHRIFNEMKSLMVGIVEDIANIAVEADLEESEEDINHHCENCGLSFEKFKETGFLGCPYCYHQFRTELKEMFFDFEYGPTHVGKMPEKYSKLYVLKKEARFLKKRLVHSVHDENYEEAAKLYKKLEKLIGEYELKKEVASRR